MSDQTERLRQVVVSANKKIAENIFNKGKEEPSAFRIIGGESKQHFLPPLATEPTPDSHATEKPLYVADHRGVICYTPTELMVTVRSGTPIAELNGILAEKGQMLAFEPPEIEGKATVGGTVAMAMAGSSGGYYGVVKDFILGIHIINGNGEVLRFGGEVMKNVAGYDVSRLMTGAMGTLGIILQASIKVLPIPQKTLTLQFEKTAADAINLLTKLASQPYPITAGCYDSQAGILHLRLAGGEAAVNNAKKKLGGEPASNDIWQTLRELKHPIFSAKKLWQIKTIKTPLTMPTADYLLEWGGQRIWFADTENFDVAAWATSIQAQTTLNMNNFGNLHTMSTIQRKLLTNIKKAFDPYYIFNPRLSPRTESAVRY